MDTGTVAGKPPADSGTSPTGGSERPYRVIAFSAIGAAGVGGPTIALPLAGPQLSQAAALNGAQLGFVAGAAGLGLTVAMLLGGDLTDRIGTARGFGWGAAISAVGATLSVWSTFAAVMIGMFLVGSGTAVFAMAAMKAVTTALPSAKVRAFAVFGFLFALVGALLSLAIGIVADQGWFRGAIVLGLPLAVVAAIALRSPSGRSAATRTNGRPPRDPIGATLAALSTGALFVGISLAMRGNSPAVAIALLVVGVASIPVLVWWERRRLDPLLDISLLRDRRFLVPTAVYSLASLGFGGAAALAAMYAQLVLGASGTAVALLILPSSVLGAAAALASPTLMARWGARVLVGGALTLAFAACSVAVITMSSGPVGISLVGASIVTIIVALVTSPLRALVADSRPAGEIGRAFGLFATLRRFSMVIGTALVVQSFVAALPGELHESLTSVGADSAVEMGVDTVGSALSMREQMAARLSPEQLDVYLAAQDQAFVAAQRHGLAIAAVALLVATVLAGFLPSKRSRHAA